MMIMCSKMMAEYSTAEVEVTYKVLRLQGTLTFVHSIVVMGGSVF